MPLGRKYRQNHLPELPSRPHPAGPPERGGPSRCGRRYWRAGKIVECAECTANIGDPLPTWVDSRGLDAETLANVAHHFDSEFWLEHKAARTIRSWTISTSSTKPAGPSSRFHAQKDWDTDSDYWEQIDWFMSA